MIANGSGQIPLTANGASDTEPDWQRIAPFTVRPTGKIAFVGSGDGNSEIYSMLSDGSSERRLTFELNNDFRPAWSPDGSQIAFASLRNGGLVPEIYVMNADGSNPVRLTANASSDDFPSWSPDGNRIAFTSDRDGGFPEIYVMNADGSGQTRLTNGTGTDAKPSWSPDGAQIAFQTRTGGSFEIYVMNANGSGQTRLTINPAEDEEPSWSPDGTQIAFASNRDGNFEIYVMNPDGTGQTRLTNNPGVADREPGWSPDGSQIAFTSSNVILTVMNSDGSNQAVLALGFNPAFQPDPDTDGDGVPDFADNCTLLANPTQCDSDADGYGNRCDGDLNDNNFTNAQDATLFRQQLGQPSVGPVFNEADMNCNGFVNAQDVTLFRGRLGSPPGPSGVVP